MLLPVDVILNLDEPDASVLLIVTPIYAPLVPLNVALAPFKSPVNAALDPLSCPVNREEPLTSSANPLVGGAMEILPLEWR